MTSLPGHNDLILVAFLPSPRDLEIARVLGWYRIPLRTATTLGAVDYLAFYQPASFGEGHKWCVEFVAEVRGHELLTRAQILKEEASHPHANEEYFKLRLGSVTALPEPIPAADWKRQTFLYTTGERLLNAADISELGVHDEERQVLGRALRERANASQQYGAAELPELPADADLLALLGLLGGNGFGREVAE
jgi:hypothetical protein